MENTPAMTDTTRLEARWISDFAEHAASSELFYNELDQKVGDGDFGTNLSQGGSLAKQRLAESDARPLAVMAEVFLDEIGGSSGPLFGLLFGNIERATRDGFTVETLARGVEAGRDAIVRIGHAELGDKTLIDALTPLTEALLQAAAESRELADALSATAAAGSEGAERTREYRARRGRASYVGERAIGAIDPGASAIAELFRTAAKSC